MERWAIDHFDAKEAEQRGRGGSLGEVAKAILPRTVTSQAGLLRARARYWRSQGRTEAADELDQQANAMMPPSDELPPPTHEPIGGAP